MTQRPSFSKKVPWAFLGFLSLAKCLIVTTALAQTPAVVDPPAQPRIPTEAEACSQALVQIHDSGLAQRLQRIVWDDLNVDEVVAGMRKSGQIRSDEQAALVDAQLRIGVLFARQGLLHEAMYQVFEPRYKSAARIADAIRAFGQITTAEAQSELISEIIERVLQYIPDVDGNNLDKIQRTATFIKMSQSAMQDFRARWILYDDADEFALKLQNGILAVLTSASPQLIEDVNSRGGLFKRFFAKSNTLEIPDRPFVINDELTIKQVEQENRAYYEDESYLNYLRQSSSAARRFFVLNRLRFLTREQIAVVLQNKEAWWLKPSLIETLKAEDLWREKLNRKFQTLDGLRRDLVAAQATLQRKENGESFDSIAVGRAWGGLREIQNAAEWRARATKVLEDIYTTAPAKDFVGTLANIKEASLPIHGKYRETMGFIESAVTFSNVIGLKETQAQKVQRDLTDLAEKFSGKSREVLIARIKDVKVASSYTQMSIEQLRQIIPELSDSVRAADEDLERTYARTGGEAVEPAPAVETQPAQLPPPSPHIPLID